MTLPTSDGLLYALNEPFDGPKRDLKISRHSEWEEVLESTFEFIGKECWVYDDSSFMLIAYMIVLFKEGTENDAQIEFKSRM